MRFRKDILFFESLIQSSLTLTEYETVFFHDGDYCIQPNLFFLTLLVRFRKDILFLILFLILFFPIYKSPAVRDLSAVPTSAKIGFDLMTHAQLFKDPVPVVSSVI